MNRKLTAGKFEAYELNDLHSHLLYKIFFPKIEGKNTALNFVDYFFKKSINYGCMYGIHVHIRNPALIGQGCYNFT